MSRDLFDDFYRNNTIHVALFVIGLMGSIFGGFVSVVAAQSPMEMMQGMMMGAAMLMAT